MGDHALLNAAWEEYSHTGEFFEYQEDADEIYDEVQCRKIIDPISSACMVAPCEMHCVTGIPMVMTDDFIMETCIHNEVTMVDGATTIASALQGVLEEQMACGE